MGGGRAASLDIYLAGTLSLAMNYLPTYLSIRTPWKHVREICHNTRIDHFINIITLPLLKPRAQKEPTHNAKYTSVAAAYPLGYV